MQKMCTFLSPILPSPTYNFQLQINPSTQGTYAMLGEPLHVELSFGIPIVVQECPIGKLQLAYTSELK